MLELLVPETRRPERMAMRTVIIRLVIDVTILATVGLTVLFVNLFATPFRRGFFCNDESIRYPYHTGTVSSLAVALGGLLIPVAIIGVIELSCPRGFRPSPIVVCCPLNRWFVRWFRVTGVFLFGAGLQQMIVDIAKLWLGRLRPYFIDVCNPKMAQECTLNGTRLYTYVTDYTCQGTDESRIEEGRLSFPSGHASLSCYAAVFLIMYIQSAYPWNVSKLLKHVLQFLLAMGAWFTSLSRITDNHHHPTDVLGGIVIGSLFALLTVIFISDLACMCPSLHKQEDDDEDGSLMASTTNQIPTTATTRPAVNGAGV